MKEWECVQVGHYKNIGKTIEEYQKEGWRLHTYQATVKATHVIRMFPILMAAIETHSHYLLFEKGE